MMSRYEYHGGVWVDLENPSEDEVRRVVQEFSIDERLEAELLSPTPMSLVANGVGMTFLVLYFPTHGSTDGESKDQEVDCVVGDKFIITVHYEVVTPIHRLQKLLETQQIVASRDVLTTDVLLEILFTHLYTSVRDHINHIVDRLTHVEKDMFNGLERNTVRSISNVSREFLHINASLANQEEPFDRFLKTLSTRGFFGTSFIERADRMRAERLQVAQLATTHRAVATELRETNIALLGARQNEIMKTLTVITFSMLPLELITLVFGMHALGAPLEHNPNAFWIILAAMLGVGGLMMIFFARRHWLS